MTAFAAALNALNLSQNDATELLANSGRILKRPTVADWVNGRSRVPEDVWQRMGDLFEMVEAAADEIQSDQGEAGANRLSWTVDVAAIRLPHRKLRAAAAARAMLVLGPQLLVIAEEAD